jgi:hypothetical protein
MSNVTVKGHSSDAASSAIMGQKLKKTDHKTLQS